MDKKLDWLANAEYAASIDTGRQAIDWQDKLLVDLSACVELKPTNWSFVWGLRKICRSNENLHRVFNGIGSEAPSIVTPGFKSKKPAVFKRVLQDAYGMSSGTPSREDGSSETCNFSPEIYLTFIYLVTLYHIRFGSEARRVKQDIANFQYCLKEFDRKLVPHILPMRSDHWPDSQYSGVLDRLAFEMIKIDISARTFDLQGDILRQPWSEARYTGTYMELFSRSQYAAYELWGPGLYPMEESQDDLETARAQELHAWSHFKRYDVAILRHDKQSGVDTDLEVDRLLMAFLEYMTKYMQLINYAMRETPGSFNRRLMAWARYSVAHFYAAALEFHRVAHWDKDPRDDMLARTAMEGILVVALKLYESDDENALMRIAWPLLLAGMETREPLHQAWVIERFSGMTALGTNFARASACLKYVVERQRAGEPRQDFLKFVREKTLEAFVLH